MDWGWVGQSRDGFGAGIFGHRGMGLGDHWGQWDGFGGPWAQWGCGGGGLGSSGLVGMGWSWGIFGHSEGGFGGSLGTAGMFWGDLGHRGMGDLWAQRGQVGGPLGTTGTGWGPLGTVQMVALPRPTFIREVGADQVGLGLFGQGQDVDGRRVGDGATETLHLLEALSRVQSQVEICRGKERPWGAAPTSAGL